MVISDARIIAFDVHFHDELCATMCSGVVVNGFAFDCAEEEVWHIEMPEQVACNLPLHALQLKAGIINQSHLRGHDPLVWLGTLWLGERRIV